MSNEDFDAAAVTDELLSDPAALEEIRLAEQAIVEGDYITGDELRVKYGLA